VALARVLRQSETLGHRWSDVNLDTGTLSVQRTLQRVNGVFTVFPPKTARSRRTIAMPAPVAAALRQHMKRQLEERLLIVAAWDGDAWGALGFTDEVGRPLTSFHGAVTFASYSNRQDCLRCVIMIYGTEPLPSSPPRVFPQGWRWRFWATPRLAQRGISKGTMRLSFRRKPARESPPPSGSDCNARWCQTLDSSQATKSRTAA
jgi:integrase